MSTIHRVGPGERLSEIAVLHGVPYQDIVAANPGKPLACLASGEVVFAALAEGEDIEVPGCVGDAVAGEASGTFGALRAFKNLRFITACPSAMYNTYDTPACYTRFLAGTLGVDPSWYDPSAVYFVLKVNGETRIGAYSPKAWSGLTPKDIVAMTATGILPIRNMLMDKPITTGPKGVPLPPDQVGFYGEDLAYGIPADSGVPVITRILYGLRAGHTLSFARLTDGNLALVTTQRAVQSA